MRCFPVNKLTVAFLAVPLLLLASSCSQQPASPASSAPAARQAPPAAQPAQPSAATSPAQPASSANVSVATPSGARATEAHTLSLTNYAKVGVTATLNGGWVGQWDSSVNVPLDTVVQGKNELKVDVPQKPDGVVTVEVFAQRGQEKVNLLRLNFQDKPAGSYTYYFAAR
ncbi:MAG TPA: hypothetical protein VFI95_08670 [Terriglobales bacterium]|jgi:hypothetical protein|nr:hypothetical protein [Terriglobales bacterium]